MLPWLVIIGLGCRERGLAYGRFAACADSSRYGVSPLEGIHGRSNIAVGMIRITTRWTGDVSLSKKVSL
jgi:hypothetical protein